MSFLFMPLRLRVVISTWIVACLVGFVWPFVLAHYLEPIYYEDVMKEQPQMSQGSGPSPSYRVSSHYAPFGVDESAVDENADGKQDLWLVSVNPDSSVEKVYLVQDRDLDDMVDTASYVVGPAPENGVLKGTTAMIILVTPEFNDSERVVVLAKATSLEHELRYRDYNGDGIFDVFSEQDEGAVLDWRIHLSDLWLRLVDKIDDLYYICETETGVLAPTYWDGYAWVLGTPQ